MQPSERLEITDAHSLAAIVARDPQFPERRRRLMRLVAATVGVCAVILVAAGIARLIHTPPNQAASAPITIVENPPAPPTPPPAAVAPAPAEPLPVPTTGTLLIQKPAIAGHVWFDGKKLSQSEQSVACGKHKVKVGTWGRAHTVDVPCGGELKVTK